MSVEVADNPRIYAGDGVVAEWPTPFFTRDSDIEAIFRFAEGGSRLLVLDQDYTLSGARSPTGGTLTILDSSAIPGPSSGTLIVATAVPITQDRRFSRSGAFDTKEGEAAWDKLTIICQQLAQGLRGAIRSPIDDLAGDMELVVETARANGFLGFDSTGLPLVYDLAGLVNLLRPFIVGDASTKTTVLSREELGLVGDGVTDDSVALNKAISLWSGRGGATFFLQPQPGLSFYLAHPVRVRSFVQLLASGAPFKLSASAKLSIEGDFGEIYGSSPLGLVAAGSQGGSTLVVDTAPQGGGAVSSLFDVGDYIIVRGLRDGAGNVSEYGEHRIDAISDGTRTLTLGSPLGFAYEPVYAAGSYETNFSAVNRTEITKKVQGLLTTDAAEGSNVVEVAAGSFSSFTIDDYVIVEDDKRAQDVVVGASAGLIHSEIAQIIDVNVDGANTFRLNRRLERTYTTAYNARVTLLDPALRASIEGASVVFTQPPVSAAVAAFEMTRCVECEIVNPQVPNEDAFGSLGPMFRLYQSCDSKLLRPVGRNPKSTVSGSGQGCTIDRSTGCVVVEPNISGCRYNLLFVGATQCHALDVNFKDDQLGSIVFAGLREVGCTVTVRGLTGGTRIVADSTTKRAVRFGGPTTMVGPYRCVVQDGRVAQYKGAGTAVVEFMPGAEECTYRNGQCDDIETLLWHGDNAEAPGLIERRCSLEEVVVNGYAGKLIDIDGGRNGSATKTVENLTIRDVRAYGGSKHVFLTKISGCKIFGLILDNVTVDGTEPFAVKASAVDVLRVSSCRFMGTGKGVAATTCPAMVISRCDFWDMTGTDVFQDNGGNTGYQWRYNDYAGFMPTKDIQSLSSGGIEFPVAITSTATFVTIS